MYEKVKELLVEELSIKAEDITPESELVSDLGINSLELADLVLSCEEKFDIERSTGNVKFSDCDAAELFVETSTGDVKGSLLSAKVFIVKTDTGSADVPKTITGGRCEIETDTGDIKITVK